ncbi:hypothetical protein DNTS_010303 [Danionella cerebrum]|uniref:Fibronectin type III domain-containing protein 10 n=1 Tax=Danionella cerebrum TaxID=2873325 RepID=A0A553MRD4_9TELE|nr:hypothetical protein DNTS_010303 [Danionella translucida]
MARRHLLESCVILVVLSGSGSALPNRTGSLAHAQNVRASTLGGKLPLHQLNSSTSNRRGVLGESGPLCAYRNLDSSSERLCFRYTLPDFKCAGATCRQVTSTDGLVKANILSNGSVLVQWTFSDASAHPGVASGFRLGCLWNGSFAQFQCAGVHLGSSCRDYLLSDLHVSVPYRLCVRPFSSDQPEACVEFSLMPGGMQDIVIAMTTVGGAICVMLVIICLLVAYITENIMNPVGQHSHRSHTL